MRRVVKTGIFVGATAAVVISGTMVSYASWILPEPAATAKVQSPSMPGGVTPHSEKKADGNALVTWKPQELAGVKMTAYVVTAHDTDQTSLPPIARNVTASNAGDLSATFTAAELAGGKWKWAITPKLQSWTGAEGTLSNPKLVFPPASPTTSLAKAAAGTTTDAVQAVVSPNATAVPPPAPTSTTEGPARTVQVSPAPSATERPPAPAKTESPKADPKPSDSLSSADSSTIESAAE
jgi:hypothetical protein